MSDDNNDFNYTLIEYCGEHSGYRCGYCKTSTSNYSHGLWAHKMTCSIYQTLIDRGWRRSGKYCYKPTLDKTCCPQYTIRCDAQKFRPSKSQKKVLKRFHSFLNFGANKNSSTESRGMDSSLPGMHEEECMQPREFTPKDVPSHINLPGSSIRHKKDGEGDKEPPGEVIETSRNKNKLEEAKDGHSLGKNSSCSELKEVKPGVGADPSKPVRKKAKLIRREKYEAKMAASASSPHKNLPQKNSKSKKTNEPKTLEDFLNPPAPDSPAHKLEVRLVAVSTENQEYVDTFDTSHSVYLKYQMAIHGDPESKCTKSKYKRFLCNSPLQLRLVPVNSKDREFVSTFKSSHEVFRHYQTNIHKDPPSECDESAFKNFLVDGPLTFQSSVSGPPKGYGSFHQQYWLDGELIAVGVLDILPDCVSSVYFYYDSKFSNLSLGTYSSLRELALARELSRITGRKVWYYMGFYIHSCPKMRYKGQYSPSYLLCPETYTWAPIDKCLPKLDRAKYATFSGHSSRQETLDIGMIPCLLDGRVYTVLEMRRKKLCSDEDLEDLNEYLRLVGRRAASQIIVYRG